MPPLGSSSGEGAGLGRTLADPAVDSRDLPGRSASQPPAAPEHSILPGVQLVRHGKRTRFLDTAPKLSSIGARWRNVALEDYKVPALLIARHEHPEHFVHVVLSGSVMYEVTTRGRTRRFTATPGTTFLLPRGTVDEVRWEGPTHRLALAMDPKLLTNAMEETRHGDVELTEHWDLIDHHIPRLLEAMTADLLEGSPVGRLYGESLANALAVYLAGGYAVRRSVPVVYKGGLPGRRLKMVLDYIGDNLAEDLSLSQLAAVAGMSAHYFSALFKQSTGFPPHSFVLSQRIDRAKESLRDPRCSVLDAGMEAGFQNSSHFARAFRKLVGVTPRQFRGSA
jgi:AraC family transcriptional regulator